MGKIAFVFSGQGDQYLGMGKDLYEKYPLAKELFTRFDAIRTDTSRQCFFGTEEELKETVNTQPCLYAMELAAASVLMEKGIYPDVTAGFSLGEVAAAAVSGLFDYGKGFHLVCRRGELMQREAKKFDTAMAAVLKLSKEQLRDICKKYSDIYPVNFNCPGQITVSGLSSDFPAFFADVKQAGGRVIPLKVKGAFHSPFMNEAAKSFKKEVEQAKPALPEIPLYSNQTAKPYTTEISKLLSEQICSPVQWEALIRNMIDDNVDTFIEIGPGKTLTNMIRKISKEVKAVSYTEYLSEVEAC